MPKKEINQLPEENGTQRSSVCVTPCNGNCSGNRNNNGSYSPWDYEDIKELTGGMAAVKQSQKDLVNECRTSIQGLRENTQSGFNKLSADISKNEDYTRSHITKLEASQGSLQELIRQQTEQLRQFGTTITKVQETLQRCSDNQHRLNELEKDMQEIKTDVANQRAVSHDTWKVKRTTITTVVVAAITALGSLIAAVINLVGK